MINGLLYLAVAAAIPVLKLLPSDILYVIAKHLFLNEVLVPGWTSIMSAITIFGTIQLLLLGVFGEYLGRVYEQVKNRPLYIVQEITRANPAGAAGAPAVSATATATTTATAPESLTNQL